MAAEARTITRRIANPLFLTLVFAAFLAFGLAGCEEATRTGDPASASEPAAVETQASTPRVLTARQIAEWYDVLQQEERPLAACQDGRSQLAETDRSDPNWSVLAYLVGEVCRETGDAKAALDSFEAVASTADPAGASADSTGAAGAATTAESRSGLAAIALWRWLQLLDGLDRAPDEQIDRVLAAAQRLQSVRAFEGMVRSGLLPALPRLEEDVSRRLASVARKAGRPEANDLLLAFFNIDSSGELTTEEAAQAERMIADGVISRPRMELLRYRRQLSLVQTKSRRDEIAAGLEQLWRDPGAPDLLRAEAAYEWGNYHRRDASQSIDAFTAALELTREQGRTAELALYGRAMAYNNRSNRRTDLFFRDLRQLIEQYPQSRLVDDALYQIGNEHIFGLEPNLDAALESFRALRAITTSNDWADSAYFAPALGHLLRGAPGDLQAADEWLKAYLTDLPDGVFRFRCLFWRGRIAELNGDAEAARNLYRQVLQEAPFGYYGIRARMHLEGGAAVVNQSLPAVDSTAFAELRALRAASAVPDGDLPADTPSAARLRAARESGLYERLRSVVDGLGRRYRNRLDSVELNTLDKDGQLPAVALLLSWRQDALTDRDQHFSADRAIRLSALLGHGLSDWPIAMMLVSAPASAAQQSALQQDPAYLAVAYPGIEALRFLEAPLQESAWPLAGSIDLGRSLMYAVMRQESAFFPSAISNVGALGLFQIMPSLFRDAKSACRRGADPNRPTAALFDPGRNAYFWACWVQDEFKPADRDALALTLVKHQAGMGNLASWAAAWKGRPIEHDLELQIEALRFPATQAFVRSTLADIAVAESTGLSGGVERQGAVP